MTDTKTRLLEAAADAFADAGYRRTTIRHIAARAGANVAAVNYHFGDKAALYQATHDYVRARSNAANPLVQRDRNRDFNAGEPPERRLYLFVRTLVGHIFRDGRATRLARLMLHEMVSPTPALDRLVEGSVRRVHAALRAIVADLLGAPADDDRVRITARAVGAQVHMLHLGRALEERLDPEHARVASDADLDRLAEEITAFTLAAIRGMRAGAGGAPPRKAGGRPATRA